MLSNTASITEHKKETVIAISMYTSNSVTVRPQL